jgi:AraC family transcriptional regulator, arabinose operon regulatory protein
MKNGKKSLSNIDFDIYEYDIVYRSLALTPDERFGAGFIFKPGNRLEYDNSIHPRFALIIVLRGEGTLYDENGEKFKLRAGMCFKRVPGKAETLSIKDDGKWVEFFIEIGPALYQALRLMRIIETKPLCENIEIDVEFFEELMLLKEQFKTIDERALALVVGDFAKILAGIQRRCSRHVESKENVLIDSACAFLGRDFSKNCDMKAFCRKQGVGYESFRKLFKNQIGVSPWQYRIRRRLDLACALLQDPQMQINEIALELGYSSAYDFSAQFKKYFKVSPVHYRAGSKGKNTNTT